GLDEEIERALGLVEIARHPDVAVHEMDARRGETRDVQLAAAPTQVVERDDLPHARRLTQAKRQRGAYATGAAGDQYAHVRRSRGELSVRSDHLSRARSNPRRATTRTAPGARRVRLAHRVRCRTLHRPRGA